MNLTQQRLKDLPAIDRLLATSPLTELAKDCPALLLTEAARETVAQLRRELLDAPTATLDLSPAAVAHRAAQLAQQKMRPSLRPVINATGTLLHTNLGRAPLCEAALNAATAISRSYSNLEYDLATGSRGHRYSHVEALLCRLTGAEAATVVNNNAGAVLLALAALAQGKEAPVSRGELIEIGGSFRVPDVMAASGVRLREIGTTNKTHLQDYRDALNAETGLLLKIHTSNYRIVGFTAEVSGAQLVKLGAEAKVPVMEDLGSGLLFDLSAYGLPAEPTVADTVKTGLDVVTCSGDKLFGGPQAGIIVGQKWALDKIRQHPLARALRIDKMTLAALEATLMLYLDRDRAAREIPTLRMLTAPEEALHQRATILTGKLAAALGATARIDTITASAAIGGGALPLTELPGYAVAVAPTDCSVDTLAKHLRHTAPPVIGCIRDERLLLHLRTLHPDEEPALVTSLAAALLPSPAQ
ncbi:MAG: L-seryl-tRNA(Sec) selenium transferase [Desulfuromonadales bacterium]|nr:L-seryl-tRNA(Sec) selenium transferase [Desulfuromonadales bacterium]